ncbi:MAG: uracil-DNA glycosylase [Candidatus Methylacidiphilales bacterium]
MNFTHIQPDWLTYFKQEASKSYFHKIVAQISADTANGLTIFPPNDQIFEAFKFTSLLNTKVVILGQDPYHGSGEANGLCFSVNKGIKVPPSLRNIYKELATDINHFKIPNHGNIENWAKQGVLLLNTSLTVIKDKANSHGKIGWHQFTNKIIETISNQKEDVVFILWGKNAHDKMEFINPNKHFMIKSVHPSPLSASRGFFGSKPFSKTNEYLIANNKTPIDWSL